MLRLNKKDINLIARLYAAAVIRTSVALYGINQILSESEAIRLEEEIKKIGSSILGNNPELNTLENMIDYAQKIKTL